MPDDLAARGAVSRSNISLKINLNEERASLRDYDLITTDLYKKYMKVGWITPGYRVQYLEFFRLDTENW